MELPESVIDLLTGLRDYLQDKCEPPVYVSDRRFMKAINLLQVAAFADGRTEVSSLRRQAGLASGDGSLISKERRRGRASSCNPSCDLNTVHLPKRRTFTKMEIQRPWLVVKPASDGHIAVDASLSSLQLALSLEWLIRRLWS